MTRATIVVPCYNATATLRETLQSIVDQSFEDLEVLVVDDGSDDDPSAIVREVGDPRVHYARIEHTGGPARPRNLAVERARGDVVFFCDADDVMLPGKVETQVAELDARPDLGMVFTDFEVVDSEGSVLVPSFLAEFDTLRWVREGGIRDVGGYDPRRVARGLLRANFVGTSSVAVRRQVLRRAGPFDASLASSEDFDLWMRVVQVTECIHLDRVYGRYRRHAASLSNRRSALHPLARLEVLGRYAHLVEDDDRGAYVGRLVTNHVGAAYVLRDEGRWSEARIHYARALRLRPGWRPLRAWLSTFPGPRALVRARRDQF